jgi:hypothetical protein
MRLSKYTALLAIFGALLFFFSGCGKNRGPSTPAVKLTDSGSTMAEPIACGESQLTEEDRMLLSMPYEERLAYLEDKLKQLVFEMHGIVTEESVSAV